MTTATFTTALAMTHRLARQGLPVRGLPVHRLAAAATVVAETTAAVTSLTRLGRDTGPVVVSRPDPADLRTGRLREVPVMLVHGLGANKTSFAPMARHLRRAGFTVYAVDYSCREKDLAGCGRQLVEAAALLREQTGCEQAHVVAHSLGGIVLRWAVTHTWMRDWVRVAITLGSPHRGTPAALAAPVGLPGVGGLISQLRPGAVNPVAPPPRGTAPGPTRWVAVAGGYDWLVPPDYAGLPPADGVRNVRLPRTGHLALPRDTGCLRLVLDELTADEDRDDGGQAYAASASA